MNETVTVRVQKVKKNRIRIRLIFFLILTAALLLVAIFADKIVPYDPMRRICQSRFSRLRPSTGWALTATDATCSPA